MSAPSTTSDPLSNTLNPVTAATLTIRVIKSFDYRTYKNVILHSVDLTTTTVAKLREDIMQNTLKLYTKAHGAKTMNLIINMDHDEDWILADDNKTLADYGIASPATYITSAGSDLLTWCARSLRVAASCALVAATGTDKPSQHDVQPKTAVS
ncbi:hypothetical protein B0O80DRAFT_426751 [Mortierella sp. GBAus27b]|nr:hypothetical protein B0O80DRAFT_426751 [Mortierella sp. GBAus27b]